MHYGPLPETELTKFDALIQTEDGNKQLYKNRNMIKKYSYYCIAICLISCQNQEIDFPDFDYTTGYFPYQYPIRTIILGDYIYDNSNDNNHEFVILQQWEECIKIHSNESSSM